MANNKSLSQGQPSPFYQVEDKVYYERANRVGIIMGVANIGDLYDIRLNGHKYFLLIGNVMHTVPGSLLSLEKKGMPNPKRIEASFIRTKDCDGERFKGQSDEPTPEEVLLKLEERGPEIDEGFETRPVDLTEIKSEELSIHTEPNFKEEVSQ